MIALVQKNQKTHKLAQNGGQGSAGNAHVKDENKQRVQQNIEHTAGSQADHAIKGIALEPQQIVEDEGGGHVGSADENDPQIVYGIGQDRIRGAQEPSQGLQEDQPQDHNDRAEDQGGKEANGGQCFRPLGIPAA